DCLTAGFSIYMSDRKGPKGALESLFRPRAASHGKVFDQLLKRVVRGGRYQTYWHRVEKKEWTQHAGLPRRTEDWQTLQAWIVRKVFPPSSRKLASPGFAREVERIFRELYPLYVFSSVPGPRWQADL
ncbi:MAG TPA: hypothetical protein VKU44_04915, partial [Terriglobia bacterium]|nr:hypothetical protein [Terriglobia bacterium]